MISRRQAIASGAILVLLGLMVAWSSGSLAFWNPAANRPDDRPAQEGQVGTEGDEAEAGPAQTKRSVRDMGKKPTLEETQDILRTTIISKIDIKEATLEETVAELNRLARSHGIPERELTFLIAPHLAKDLRSSPVIIRDFRVRNAPLAVLVKYLVGGTKLRFRVDPGRAIFRSHGGLDEEAVPVEQEEIGPDGDPFAEPGQEVRAEKKPVDPDDPFSQEDSE